MVVLGTGPVNAAAALNLAPFLRVLVVERATDPLQQPGESLPAADRRLRADMGLWESFRTDGHRPCPARASRWGGDDRTILDAVRDPDEPGWHIDGTRFDARLREMATARGAAILAPAQPLTLARASGAEGWALTLSHRGHVLAVRARGEIDARGRRSRPLPAFRTQREVEDRLACGWVVLDDAGAGESASSLTQAEAEGWWYAARLPGDEGGRLLAFYTDADQDGAAGSAASSPRGSSPTPRARALRWSASGCRSPPSGRRRCPSDKSRRRAQSGNLSGTAASAPRSGRRPEFYRARPGRHSRADGKLNC